MRGPCYISAPHPGHLLLLIRVNRPLQSPTDPQSATAVLRRSMLFAVLAGYLILVMIAWATRSDLLSAICVVLLVSAVLGPRLRARSHVAWLTWTLLVVGVGTLAVNGLGRMALDLVPLAINLGLAGVFGLSLTGAHTPLIARAIIAIEGRERLAQPRVAGYARSLTLAWTVLFVMQSVAFVWLMWVVLPELPADARACLGDDRAARWRLSAAGCFHARRICDPALVSSAYPACAAAPVFPAAGAKLAATVARWRCLHATESLSNERIRPRVDRAHPYSGGSPEPARTFPG